MQTKQSIITLVGAAILLLFALAVISFVPPAPTIHALAPSLEGEGQPHVGFDTLDDWVAAGEYMNAGLLFANFPCIDKNDDDKCDYNDRFTTVTYRFDVMHEDSDADNCEGQGLGIVRTFPESRSYNSWRTLSPIPLRIDRNCPHMTYTMKCTVTYTEPGSDVAIPVTCNGMDFTVGSVQQTATATPTETPIPPTATPTATPIPATSTPTETPIPPTSTPTATPIPPTATPTATEESPRQEVPPEEDPTPTATPTVDDSVQNAPPQDPTATPTPTEMSPPNARIEELPSSFNQGQQTNFKMVFENLDDSDQYGYRADVTKMDDSSAADNCEGTGLGGKSQYTAHLTGMVKNHVTVSGEIDTSCPASKYSVSVTLMDSGGQGYSTSREFQVVDTDNPTPTATPTLTATPMPPPSVKIEGLSSAWDHGQQASFNMIFEGIDDSDDYGYRADVTNADNNDVDDCEGTGLGGANQYTAELTGAVDGKLTVPGLIDARCPSGTYTLTATLLADGGYTYTATQDFQVNGLTLSPHRSRHANSNQHARAGGYSHQSAAATESPATEASRHPYQHARAHAYSKSRLCAAPAEGRPDIDAYTNRNADRHPGPNPCAYGHT